MEFKWKVFVIILLFTLVLGALSNLSLFLFRMFDFRPEVIIWVSIAINIVTFSISPLLLFGCFYVMGGNMDLVVDLTSVVVSLFLGAWIGHLIGYFSLQFIYNAWYGAYYGVTFVGPWISWAVYYAFRFAFSLEFFVGFAASSMAYIVRKRSVQIGA